GPPMGAVPRAIAGADSERRALLRRDREAIWRPSRARNRDVDQTASDVDFAAQRGSGQKSGNSQAGDGADEAGDGLGAAAGVPQRAGVGRAKVPRSSRGAESGAGTGTEGGGGRRGTHPGTAGED